MPGEEQLVASMSDDPELMLAITERANKAREFHGVLTKAMSQSQTPLSKLLVSIRAFMDEVDEQLQKQTDSEIRRELELINENLSDHRDQAEEFSENWDLLGPKVAGWQPGDDPDLLLEYQKRAEVLVREFHAKSRVSLGLAIKQGDQIGRTGTEMAMRRVIQSALAKFSHVCFETRNEWILAASGVVPANNLELKALRITLVNLVPRIQERREAHKAEVAKKLVAQRDAEWTAELGRLKQELEDANQRQRELNGRMMAVMDDVAEKQQATQETLQARRDEVEGQQEVVAELDREWTRLVSHAQHLESGQEITMAGAVSYGSLKPVLPSQFDFEKIDRAAALGGGVAVAFILVFWFLSRPRRPRVAAG